MSYLPRSLRHAALLRYDVLTTTQLIVDGELTRDFLRSQVDQGHWQRLYRGIYATFSGEPAREARLWAAVLAAGPGAMLSHQTAAETGHLTDTPSRLIHTTVPGVRRVSRIPGVAIHYSARADEARHPVLLPPQTRVEETVLDLAGTARSLDDTVAWVTSALGRGLTTQAELRQAMSLRARMRWRGALAELLGPDAAGLHSILEYRYHHGVERPHGLPGGLARRGSARVAAPPTGTASTRRTWWWWSSMAGRLIRSRSDGTTSTATMPRRRSGS